MARPGRCANHPGMGSAAACSRCRRPLCVSCAVPVRGIVLGPECLPEVLEDAPGVAEPSNRRILGGDLLAILGFGTVVALSILPWSRFGDASGTLEAWTVHWSLAAAAAGTVGFLAAVAFWMRPRDPRLEVAVYVSLAFVVIGASFLHRLHPPSLSTPSAVPLLAVGAGVVALLGAAIKAGGMIRSRRAQA